MNIYDALNKAREKNTAVTRSDFPKDVYVQHGMDNLLRFADRRELTFAVADLLSDKWELYDKKPYHPKPHCYFCSTEVESVGLCCDKCYNLVKDVRF